MVEFFQRAMKLLWWAYLLALAATLIVTFAAPPLLGEEWVVNFLGTPIGQAAYYLLMTSAGLSCILTAIAVPVFIYEEYSVWRRRRRRSEREAHLRSLREMYSGKPDNEDENS